MGVDYALAQGMSRAVFSKLMNNIVDEQGRDKLFQWALEHLESEVIPLEYWTNDCFSESATRSPDKLLRVVPRFPSCLIWARKSIFTKAFVENALSANPLALQFLPLLPDSVAAVVWTKDHLVRHLAAGGSPRRIERQQAYHNAWHDPEAEEGGGRGYLNMKELVSNFFGIYLRN